MGVSDGGYDYVWLMDEDLLLDLFSWDVYRVVLLSWNPLFSQPAIVPKAVGERSADWPEVRMAASELDAFDVADEGVPSPEVMTPIIASVIWPSLRVRLQGDDRSSVWYLDEYF